MDAILLPSPVSDSVAGALSAETLPRAEPLLARFPRLSLDAEGRLRDGEDRLAPERGRLRAAGVRGGRAPEPVLLSRTNEKGGVDDED